MPKRKITACTAKRRLREQGIDFDQDFDALRWSEKMTVLDMAKAARYYKRKDAPGSRARMYFYYLSRKKC
jgi:hypothetical protein